MDAPFISLQQVTKKFGTLTVISALDLDIKKGEFVSLLGPSGSGKTTLLMILAGFENPTKGRVFVAGRQIDTLPPHKRNMGVVFQNYALFPHMSVRENVAFPLKMRRMAKSEIETRIIRALEMVQLAEMADRKPSQLSGGQQQRIALARALVFEPEVVLMDEPLGALDKKLREQMQLDIRTLHHQLGLTIVFVTHDQGEALTMSDRIAVFNQGRIEQTGSPDAIYNHPQTRFVAEFIGETNFTTGHITARQGRILHIALAGAGKITVHCPEDEPGQTGDQVQLSIRPERIQISTQGTTQSALDKIQGNHLPAQIIDAVYHGDHLRLHARTGDEIFVVKSQRPRLDATIGEHVTLSFHPDDVRLIK